MPLFRYMVSAMSSSRRRTSSVIVSTGAHSPLRTGSGYARIVKLDMEIAFPVGAVHP